MAEFVDFWITELFWIPLYVTMYTYNSFSGLNLYIWKFWKHHSFRLENNNTQKIYDYSLVKLEIIARIHVILNTTIKEMIKQLVSRSFLLINI